MEAFHHLQGLLVGGGLLQLPLLPAMVLCILVPIILLRKAGSKLPPGPRPALPIIGHLHLLLLSENPHLSLYNLSKTHGPLMSLRLGSVPLIVASTPAMAKQILHTHDQTFSARPATSAVAVHISGCSSILFASPGPYWKFVRQLCFTELLSNKRAESFRPVRAEEVGALMRSILLDVAAGTAVSVRARLCITTFNITSRMALGKRLSELAISYEEDSFLALLHDVLHILGVMNVSDYIPFLAWMDLQGCAGQSKVLARKLNTVLQEVIDGRRNMSCPASSNGAPHDFLDALLLASRDAEHENLQITDVHIRAILLDILFGGTDTSAITIEWALAELLANPRKMKIAQEELAEVVGTARLVQEADIPRLPYLRAVVKETMRLHPVGPLLAPHLSSQPSQISGYEIPTNTLAYVNVWAIGRDPDTWEKPLEFFPERFLDSNLDVRGQHFELLPFGSGKRACPGLTLGLLSVQTILASFLHAFHWTIVDKLDMSEKFGIAMPLANPLVAMATPKLPTYLLEAH